MGRVCSTHENAESLNLGPYLDILNDRIGAQECADRGHRRVGFVLRFHVLNTTLTMYYIAFKPLTVSGRSNEGGPGPQRAPHNGTVACMHVELPCGWPAGEAAVVRLTMHGIWDITVYHKSP